MAEPHLRPDLQQPVRFGGNRGRVDPPGPGRARCRARPRRQPGPPEACRQLTEDDIRALITGLGSLHDVIHDAEPSVKAAIYEQLGLKVAYLPGQDKLRADGSPDQAHHDLLRRDARTDRRDGLLPAHAPGM